MNRVNDTAAEKLLYQMAISTLVAITTASDMVRFVPAINQEDSSIYPLKLNNHQKI